MLDRQSALRLARWAQHMLGVYCACMVLLAIDSGSLFLGAVSLWGFYQTATIKIPGK